MITGYCWQVTEQAWGTGRSEQASFPRTLPASSLHCMRVTRGMRHPTRPLRCSFMSMKNPWWFQAVGTFYVHTSKLDRSTVISLTSATSTQCAMANSCNMKKSKVILRIRFLYFKPLLRRLPCFWPCLLCRLPRLSKISDTTQMNISVVFTGYVRTHKNWAYHTGNFYQSVVKKE